MGIKPIDQKIENAISQKKIIKEENYQFIYLKKDYFFNRNMLLTSNID